MATYLRHLKLQFGGTMGNPALDIWSCTVNFKCNTDDSATVGSVDFSATQLDAALGLLNTPLQAWFNSADAGISGVAKLLWAKLNQIETNGKQRDVNTHRIDTGVVTGGSNLNVPWYQTQALTMRTNASRGRGHSGRIFPPMTTAAMAGGAPYTTSATADAMAAKWATCLDGLSEAIQTGRGPTEVTPIYPVVASAAPTRVGDTGGPLLMRINGVVVDRVPDVQHRRTNAVPRLEGARSAVVGSQPQ